MGILFISNQQSWRPAVSNMMRTNLQQFFCAILHRRAWPNLMEATTTLHFFSLIWIFQSTHCQCCFYIVPTKEVMDGSTVPVQSRTVNVASFAMGANLRTSISQQCLCYCRWQLRAALSQTQYMQQSPPPQPNTSLCIQHLAILGSPAAAASARCLSQVP